MPQVKCPYCEEYFDRNKVANIKVKNRYYHVDCYKEKFGDVEIDEEKSKNNKTKIVKTIPEKGFIKTTPRKVNEKICLVCGKIVDIEKEEFRLIGNRYLHLECFNKRMDSDDKYIDEIYTFLKEDAGINYNYLQCEKQRISYNKKGMSNQDIYHTLRYAYGVKKLNTANSCGRIGIVPYLYEEAIQYYKRLQDNKKKVEKAYRKQLKNESKIVQIIDNKEPKKRDYIDIDSIGVEE